MGSWAFLVDVMFPIPFITLFLLSCPLPHDISIRVRKLLLKIVDSILFFKIGGAVSIYSLLTTISVITFGISVGEMNGVYRRQSQPTSAYSEERLRCLKWRQERNFWISLFSLTLWIVLFRFYAITQELQSLQALEDAKKKE